jgi:sulfonate transport system permease protein
MLDTDMDARAVTGGSVDDEATTSTGAGAQATAPGPEGGAAAPSGPDPAPTAWSRVTSPVGRAARRLHAGALVWQLALLAGMLLAWEHLARRPDESGPSFVDEFYVGSPSEAWDVLVRWQRSGELWQHSWMTVKEALLGFAIGALAGVAVGFVFGVMPRTSRILSPFVTGAYAIPRLALAPLFILWFGLDSASKVALVVTVVFFLIFYNTLTGVRDVDQDLVNVLRIMDAPRWEIHRRVTLPSIATWIIAGLRVSVPYAFVAAVVGEMVAAREGLGMLIQRANSQFNPSAMFAAIAVVVVLSLLLNLAVTVVERVVLRWKAPDAGMTGPVP